jgi:hypothetical protein
MVTQSSVGPTAVADSISYSRSAPACPVPRGVNTTTSASRNVLTSQEMLHETECLPRMCAALPDEAALERF